MKFLTVILKKFIGEVQEIDRNYLTTISVCQVKNQMTQSNIEDIAVTQMYHQCKKVAYELVKALDQQLATKPVMVCRDEDKQVIYQLAGVSNKTAKMAYMQIKKCYQHNNHSLTEKEAWENIEQLLESVRQYLCHFRRQEDSTRNRKAKAVTKFKDQILKDYQECTHDFRDLHNLVMDTVLFSYTHRDAIKTIDSLMSY